MFKLCNTVKDKFSGWCRVPILGHDGCLITSSFLPFEILGDLEKQLSLGNHIIPIYYKEYKALHLDNPDEYRTIPMFKYSEKVKSDIQRTVSRALTEIEA